MKQTLHSFSHLRPRFITPQEDLLKWIAAAHGRLLPIEEGKRIEEKLSSLGLGPGKIDSRGSVIGDCLHRRWEEMEIYPLSPTLPAGVSLGKRMEIYQKVVEEIFDQFYPEHTPLSPRLIHVSCTGYVSPSGAQKLVSKRQATTYVTHAYHMGCYASIPALRMALGHLHAERLSTDIVHTEACSLHMHPGLHTTEQLVVQSLFGDGFIKYSVGEAEEGLSLLALHEEIIPDTSSEMTWTCHEWGFALSIAREVPVRIARSVEAFIQQLFEKSGRPLDHSCYFAIHPGGPKIIDQLVKLLQLNPSQYAHSAAVLREYGNMSSATLPHIWQRLMEDPHVAPGSSIVSLAFGPGLSIAGALFEKL